MGRENEVDRCAAEIDAAATLDAHSLGPQLGQQGPLGAPLRDRQVHSEAFDGGRLVGRGEKARNTLDSNEPLTRSTVFSMVPGPVLWKPIEPCAECASARALVPMPSSVTSSVIGVALT